MIKRYRIKSRLRDYVGSFMMILDDKNPIKNVSYNHMRNLISKYENTYIPPDGFRETFKEVEVLGNSMHDLNPKDFRTFIMFESECHWFHKVHILEEKEYFIEQPVDLKDDEEYSEYIEQWRENNDIEYLKLAGLSLTETKPKSRRRKAKV